VSAGAAVHALLLDIEGTTSPLSFATEVLFPYARRHVRGFLERRGSEPEVRGDLARLGEEHAADVRAGLAPPPWDGSLESALLYVAFLMDRDRKSTGLKALQGRIWEEGFRSGALRGDLYADVAPAFARWRAQGRAIAIFSSGSVQAQRLVFASAPGGDLTPHLAAYFDTTTGPKREAASYRRIAAALEQAPEGVLFISDVPEELDAARAAGMQTALCVREGQAPASAHPVLRTFDTL